MSQPRDLFEHGGDGEVVRHVPLAERLRPKSEVELVLDHVDQGAFLRDLITSQALPPALLLWGPPGTGKTTLARILGRNPLLRFVEVSAVLQGIKEVRALIDESRLHSRPTLLFVDEIHRFNKAQQDAFLPHVERGTIILVGATTENPSFYLNNALLSRCKVIVFESIPAKLLEGVLHRAAEVVSRKLSDEAMAAMIAYADGDARRLCNGLEEIVARHPTGLIDRNEVDQVLQRGAFRYDRSGDLHYQLISAFIKSLRGSSPDGALYWCFRMIEAGEDPRFLLRRMMIFASEDIGNADPRALSLAVSTADAYERLGLPEGRIPIAQCVTYLASAPKSNRAYAAMNAARDAIERFPSAPVPAHLRNASTTLMKGLGYGEGYRSPHDEGGFSAGVEYLPDELQGEQFYQPSNAGFEAKIVDAMERRKRRSEQ